jgi:hypothetical protein
MPIRAPVDSLAPFPIVVLPHRSPEEYLAAPQALPLQLAHHHKNFWKSRISYVGKYQSSWSKNKSQARRISPPLRNSDVFPMLPGNQSRILNNRYEANPKVNPKVNLRVNLRTKEASRIMDRSQGQGPAWIIFLVWMLLPLLLFFLIITFTG